MTGRRWPEGGWPKLGHPVDAVVPVAQLETWADENIDLEDYARDVEYMEQLKADIRARGILNPIIVKVGPRMDPMIVGGHHRLLAAKQLGLTELPVTWQRSGPPGWEPSLPNPAKLKRRLLR